MFFVLAAVVGLLAGWAGRGSMGRLGQAQLHAWPLALAALAAHRLLPLLWKPGTDAPWPLLAALGYSLALLVFAAWNIRQAGAALVGAGAVANGVATAVSGGRMPVWVVATARMTPARLLPLLHGLTRTHVAMTNPTGVRWLGDVLALPQPFPPGVISAGDLAIALGVALFIAVAMWPRASADISAPSLGDRA